MKILILSGVHGNEQSAVQVGLSLKSYFKDNDDITVIPFANESGLIHNTREMQNSSTIDLNRAFRTIVDPVEMIKEAIDNHDLIIDIHNSPRCSNFVLIDYNDRRFASQKLCHLANVSYACRYSSGDTIKDYCLKHNKIGLTYEFSGMSNLNNNDLIQKAIQDVKSLVQTYLEKSNIVYNSESLTDLEDNLITEIFNTETGFINYVKDINDVAAPLEVLFEVYNNKNEVIETVINDKNYKLNIVAVSNNFAKAGTPIMMVYKGL